LDFKLGEKRVFDKENTPPSSETVNTMSSFPPAELELNSPFFILSLLITN
jgi:hypothetical protein